MTDSEPADENRLSDRPRGYTLVLLRMHEEGGTTTVRSLEDWAQIAGERMRQVVHALADWGYVSMGPGVTVTLTAEGTELAARLAER